MQIFDETSSKPSFWFGRWTRFALLLGSWSLFGLFFAGQVLINRAYKGRPLGISQTLISWLTCAYLWSALTPVVLYLSKRFRIERGHLINILVHLATGLLVSLVHLAIYLAPISIIDPLTEPVSAVFKEFVVTGLHFNLLTYWALVGISHTADYYRKYQDRELSSSRMRTELANAQLNSLKSQLHPHFLFNTLNAITVLVRKNSNTQAVDMLTGLSSLLRHSLEKSEAQEVTLSEELDVIRLYLDIEQVRFQDRLRVITTVETETLDALVPNLILQPLVENAIRHGIGQRTSAGLLEISARRENGELWLQVCDDGPGVCLNGSCADQHIGLANTKARLRQLYGEEQSFELCNAAEGGAMAVLKIPFRPNRKKK